MPLFHLAVQYKAARYRMGGKNWFPSSELELLVVSEPQCKRENRPGGTGCNVLNTDILLSEISANSNISL